MFELILALAVSGAGSVLSWLSRSASGLFLAGYAVGSLFGFGSPRSRRAAGLSWVPGGGLLLIGWQFPGRPWDGERTPRKCTTSQKQHQNRYGLNWENLKKIAEI